MNILLATSEAVPFAKTGGLADVCGALPPQLANLGHQVAVILPAYRVCLESGLAIQPTGIEFTVPVGQKWVEARILKAHLPGSEVPVYLVDQPAYFDRAGLYGDKRGDYPDNSERFIFFARAVCQALPELGIPFDLVHCNDWPTGLIPVYIKAAREDGEPLGELGTLFTIHNMAYQGTFWHWDMILTGLDWKYFNWQQLECYGNLNFLKSGLVFSDAINTVSPRYAEEIQSSPLGCGLEGVLQHRRSVLHGIVNGVDYNVWNPATDDYIAQKYSPETVQQGKPVCKAALQAQAHLPALPDMPLIGFVGRLAEQKGVDLLAAVIQEWAGRGYGQWVIVGTGDAAWEAQLAALAQRYPQQVCFHGGYSEAWSHQVEAGADLFVMPSRYEPCGLSQLYSLKYGTVPVVRGTGGLHDTVVNATPASVSAGKATGFAFHDYSVLALHETLTRACDMYREQREVFQQIQQTGMRRDWSWGQSAKKYAELYSLIVNKQPKPAPVAV